MSLKNIQQEKHRKHFKEHTEVPQSQKSVFSFSDLVSENANSGYLSQENSALNKISCCANTNKSEKQTNKIAPPPEFGMF